MQPGSSTANMILYGNDNPYPGTDLGLETSGVSLVREVSHNYVVRSGECDPNWVNVLFCTGIGIVGLAW